MRGILGLIVAGASSLVVWWSFNGARAGDASYDWLRAVAIITGTIGIFLIFLQIRKWWMSE
ncbi:hypothetical protein ACFLUO_06145 [Chloroflexota bacterium]